MLTWRYRRSMDTCLLTELSLSTVPTDSSWSHYQFSVCSFNCFCQQYTLQFVFWNTSPTSCTTRQDILLASQLLKYWVQAQNVWHMSTILLPTVRHFLRIHQVLVFSKLHNNRNIVEYLRNTSLLRKGLNFYRQIMLKIYIFCRYFVDYAHTNSSWTQKHMEGIWGPTLKNNLKVLFPPCSVQPLL